MATAPTSSLPPLVKIQSHSLQSISSALANLRALYFPPPPAKLSLPKRHLKSRIHDLSVPDSGYASAEEEEDDEHEVEEAEVPMILNGEDGEESDLEVLRWDHFEREYAIKWLTGFTARSDVWMAAAPSESADNEDIRAEAIDVAASLLSAFAGDLEPEAALTRTFSFPCASTGGTLEVELNDAPLSSTDHTSVGLQSWASSIVLAERICADPAAFDLGLKQNPRVLELGAGTGMLSIMLAKLLPQSSIVATDYHPDVLSNLRSNLDNNDTNVTMHTLDWSQPRTDAPFDMSFDVILAADVIYHPLHAQWIKSCVERYLARGPDSVFWLIIPMRSTGRHEGMGGTVEQVFPGVGDEGLVILSKEEIARKDGVGRADEGSYVLFKIGWAV